MHRNKMKRNELTSILVGTSLSLLPLIIPNDFQILNSFYFFLFHLIINCIILYNTGFRSRDILMPSLFSYLYIICSLTLGGYLTPRGFGFYKEYYPLLPQINNYSTINTYLLASLSILSYLSIRVLNRSKKEKFPNEVNLYKGKLGMIIMMLLFSLLLFLLNIPFGFIFGILIIILQKAVPIKGLSRILIESSILILSVKFFSFDKRNIIMVLFAIFYFRTFSNLELLKLNLKNITKGIVLLALSLTLIIIASINRGYGVTDDSKSAITKILPYINSNIFIDGITDNLELNFAYGSTYNAMRYIHEEKLPIQLGLTLIKPLFLPIPRELMPSKPWSFMHQYTKLHEFKEWLSGSSMPVIFPVELYGNFYFFGLLPLAIFYAFLNKIFMYCIRQKFLNFDFKVFAGIFIICINLIITRGSGLDLFIIYVLFGSTSYLIFGTINFILSKANASYYSTT